MFNILIDNPSFAMIELFYGDKSLWRREPFSSRAHMQLLQNWTSHLRYCLMRKVLLLSMHAQRCFYPQLMIKLSGEFWMGSMPSEYDDFTLKRSVIIKSAFIQWRKITFWGFNRILLTYLPTYKLLISMNSPRAVRFWIEIWNNMCMWVCHLEFWKFSKHFRNFTADFFEIIWKCSM